MNHIMNVVTFLACASMSSGVKTGYGRSDFLAARIKKTSTTCDTLQSFLQEMLVGMGCELDKIPPETFASAFNAAQSKDAEKILCWIRTSAESIAMLAFLGKEERGKICEGIVLPDLSESNFVAPPRRAFDVPLTIICESNLSHGGESSMGNSMLFRRQRVAPNIALPIYAGNALRGQLRDTLALHFIKNVLRETWRLETWFFHTLFAGGALTESGKTSKAIESFFGSKGTVKGDGLRSLRDMMPMLSLLGCALGNRILSGRICVGDFRPRCKEWGTGTEPAQSLFVWEFLTRRDDNEQRTQNEDHQGMIANTECLRTGTILDGGIDLSKHIAELEKSALGFALDQLPDSYIGGGNRRGFGRISIKRNDALNAEQYKDFIANNTTSILDWLHSINAIIKA